MGTEGFLLAGLESGEALILDQGRPVEIRQKFKSLIAESDGHDYVWLRYFSDYGDVKKKVFKKRLLKSFDDLDVALEVPESEPDDDDYAEAELVEAYTGDEEPAPKPIRRR